MNHFFLLNQHHIIVVEILMITISEIQFVSSFNWWFMNNALDALDKFVLLVGRWWMNRFHCSSIYNCCRLYYRWWETVYALHLLIIEPVNLRDDVQVANKSDLTNAISTIFLLFSFLFYLLSICDLITQDLSSPQNMIFPAICGSQMIRKWIRRLTWLTNMSILSLMSLEANWEVTVTIMSFIWVVNSSFIAFFIDEIH